MENKNLAPEEIAKNRSCGLSFIFAMSLVSGLKDASHLSIRRPDGFGSNFAKFTAPIMK